MTEVTRVAEREPAARYHGKHTWHSAQPSLKGPASTREHTRTADLEPKPCCQTRTISARPHAFLARTEMRHH